MLLQTDSDVLGSHVTGRLSNSFFFFLALLVESINDAVAGGCI